MITVQVHRQPIKEVRDGQVLRVARPCETKELQAYAVPGKGIFVCFPINDDRSFTKAGVGVGKMKDWVIDPKDVVLLHAMAKKK